MFQAFVLALALSAGMADSKKSYVGVMIGRSAGDTIVILSLFDDAPAAKAGLKPGDVILRINDVKPVGLEATVKVIQALKPGKKVKFLIQRDGKEKSIDVTPIAPGT